MRKIFCLSVLLATTTFPGSLHAQGGIGVAGHVGTLGVGVDVAVAAAPKIGLRAGANIMPLEIDGTFSDVDFTVELQTPQFMALVDLYPAGGFRLSGGLRYSSSNIVLTGDVTQTVDLGGTSYSLDSLAGTIVTPDIAPYVGIGFGNPAASRFGFFLDLGVAYQGEPELDLEAFGNATTLPGFDADLQAETVEVEDALKKYFKFYPVISLGFSIGF
jgi:hypothetical protein